MNLFFLGDCHGSAHSIEQFYANYIKDTPKEKEENWLILLGDAGFLYYLNKKDDALKKAVSRLPIKYFVIRGNHEARASNVASIYPDKWEQVELFENTCWREKEYPNIYYARDDGGIYWIEGRKILVIPGAYSVDKHYRLQQGWTWFPDEQMTQAEMDKMFEENDGNDFDLVLSHTCPYRYRPTDLFLSVIDQSTVDTSMEQFMDKLHDHIWFGVWLWAHYHADRVEAPYCEILFNEPENLENLESRWHNYRETGGLDWWLPKSKNFYMFEDKKGE